MIDHHQPLTVKELACALHRSRRYITYMRQRGFVMPGGLATIAEARAFMAKNPAPCSKKRDYFNTLVCS